MSREDRVALDELGRLLSLFAHDLRNPLAAVWATTDLLSEEPDLGEDAREGLADARAALIDAQRGLDQLSYVASWLEGEANAHGAPGDLAAVLEEAAGRLSLEAPVRCAPGIEVRSARLVGRVVEALLAIARDHAPRGSIRVDVATAADRAVVQLVDGGAALSPEISEMSFTLDGQTRIKSLPGARYGRCAALFACKVAIESIGGSMTAGGEDGAAFFRVVVPVAS